MSDKPVKFAIDGKEITGRRGQTIMEAADEAGVYIPRLCYLKEISPHGSYRVCVVNVNGRMQTACTQPIAERITVENTTDEITEMRKDLVNIRLLGYLAICLRSFGLSCLVHLTSRGQKRFL